MEQYDVSCHYRPAALRESASEACDGVPNVALKISPVTHYALAKMVLMSTKAALSEAEYLRTSFPGLDREFLDGEVIERTVPDLSHSWAQGAFVAMFWKLPKPHGLYGMPELRL